MLSLRLVLDTNIVVSAAMKPESLQRVILTLSLKKPARLYVTDALLAEYAEVLARPELKIRKPSRLQTLQLIKNQAQRVVPAYRVSACTDPDDNIFLECADAARADYLITGNVKHFPEFWKSTKVITTRQFIELASAHLLG